MKLVVPCFGEVGIESVVDVHLSGQWLGITIPAFLAEFILMRPSTMVANTKNLFLEPRQRGCSALKDALNRTFLWRAADALALSENPSMDDADYVRQESWIGLEVHRLDAAGVLLASAECSTLIQRSTFGTEDWVRDTLE